jgi:catechol 2,3-dioxygenase-like lactoylglutathione lyase family enzyme
MLSPNFIVIYVASPERSADFYSGLLGRAPMQASPSFVLFDLDSGVKLGLWSRHEVEPAATATAGGAEIAFAVGDAAAVETIHTDWRGRGLTILQPPTTMDFGRTFLALDPDGHRLRVFTPAAP